MWSNFLQWVKQWIRTRKSVEDPAEDEKNDASINVANVSESIIAGGDVNIQGVLPSEHAKALAQIEILREKLAIAEESRKELTPEEEEEVDEALEGAASAEESGIVFDPWEYITLGDAAELRGRTFTAESYFNEAMRLFIEAGDRKGKAASLNNLGTIALTRGDLDEAERLHRESLAIQRELGNRKGEADSFGNLGLIAEKRSDYDEAERLHRESLAIEREIGNRKGESQSLYNIGFVYYNKRSDYYEAERLYRESVRINNEIGVPLDGWFIENGYTDPDEEWDFPPPREDSD